MTRSKTLTDLFAHYLAEVRSSQAPSTQYRQGLFFDTVARELGDMRLEDITPDVLRAWKIRLGLRHKASTVYRYMVLLNCALRFAVECGWLVGNPMAKVRRPSSGRGRVRFLTSDEQRRLLEACRQSANPLLYAFVTLALWTGGRKEEIRQLQWPEVNFDQGVVRFLKTKTDRPRSVPLVGDARRVLEALAVARRPGIAWVFAGADGRKPVEVEEHWRTARRQAQLLDFKIHDLRHTFASYLAMSGGSLRDIAECLGHSKIDQALAYSHLLPSHTASVVAQMHAQFLNPTLNQERPSDG
jgi:integrase